MWRARSRSRPTMRRCACTGLARLFAMRSSRTAKPTPYARARAARVIDELDSSLWEHRRSVVAPAGHPRHARLTRVPNRANARLGGRGQQVGLKLVRPLGVHAG